MFEETTLKLYTINKFISRKGASLACKDNCNVDFII